MSRLFSLHQLAKAMSRIKSMLRVRADAFSWRRLFEPALDRRSLQVGKSAEIASFEHRIKHPARLGDVLPARPARFETGDIGVNVLGDRLAQVLGDTGFGRREQPGPNAARLGAPGRRARFEPLSCLGTQSRLQRQARCRRGSGRRRFPTSSRMRSAPSFPVVTGAVLVFPFPSRQRARRSPLRVMISAPGGSGRVTVFLKTTSHCPTPSSEALDRSTPQAGRPRRA